MTTRFLSVGPVITVVPARTRGEFKLKVRRPTVPIIFQYHHHGRDRMVTIATTCDSDGPSTFWILRMIMHLISGEKIYIATAVHDLLCQSYAVSREEADSAFNQAMRTLKIFAPLRWLVYNAVRTSSTRHNWYQKDLTPVANDDGLPAFFEECPIQDIYS